MILIDTDICVEILRGNMEVIDRLSSSNETVAISFMTIGELYFGALKSARPEHNQGRVDELIQVLNVIESDHLIMMKFGQLKADLSKIGRPLPDADVLIAAVALMHCTKLITGNTVHFARINELSIENWLV
jgi:tRNA(fMet)-specific endonuclease VapC